MFKKIIAMILSFAMMPVIASAESFSDIAGHWAESEVQYAIENNIVNGYTDGTFKPNNPITRAEFLKMLTASVCTNLNLDVTPYADETHWASSYYNFASSSNLLIPNPDFTFDGVTACVLDSETIDKPIKRWEMAYILYCVLQTVFGYDLIAKDYADYEQTAELYDENVAYVIGSCINAGLLNGDQNGNFNAANNGKRAEATAIVNRVDRLMKEILKYLSEPPQEEDTSNIKTYTEIPTGHPQVEFTMENGEKFTVELYPEYAPQTVANFVELVSNGFYDGLTFHRVIEGFMAQGGCPDGDGTGGADFDIKGEFATNGFTQNTLMHERGTISMARSNSPNSASSQFFICYDAANHLDGNYAAFGKVTDGMETIDAFLETERTQSSTGELSVPAEKIVIASAKLLD